MENIGRIAPFMQDRAHLFSFFYWLLAYAS